MDRSICPYLGTVDSDFNHGAYIEYPSFENRCWALDEPTDDGAALMLTDQATYCLASGHQYCPRFQAATAAAATMAPDTEMAASAPIDSEMQEQPGLWSQIGLAMDSDWLNSNLAELERELVSLDRENLRNRRTWRWVGAGMIFMVVVLCGGLLAAYVGWQFVDPAEIANAPGRLDTLAAPVEPTAQGPVYLIMTATSGPQPTATPLPGPVLIATSGPKNVQFPEAVTATPGGAAPNQNNPVVIAQNQQTQPEAGREIIVVNPAVDLATPATDSGAGDIQTNAAVAEKLPAPLPPTRRPTPTFEIPTSTPTPEGPAPTATATLSAPVVIFGPAQQALKPNRCTSVSWNVKNVLEVYYEGLGVGGQGSKEECIEDDAEVYSLLVVLPGGVSKTYTTTVQVIEPTATPAPTATFTPRPQPTATWTSPPPTATPTPDITFGTTLAVDGSSYRTCVIGDVCELRLVSTNLGNRSDDIIARVVQRGAGWPLQLCRPDGVCSGDSLVIAGVGPGNVSYFVARLEIPADTSRQTVTYQFRTASNNAGGAVQSEIVTVEVEVK